MRNRFILSILLEVDPHNYQHVKFTTEATICKINTQKQWYYQKCAAFGKKVIHEDLVRKCKDHGPQRATLYSDRSTTTSITCFSHQANSLTRDCNEVVAKIVDKDPYQLPSSLKELECTTHIFQFHFDTGSTSKRPNFILARVFYQLLCQKHPLNAPQTLRLVKLIQHRYKMLNQSPVSPTATSIELETVEASIKEPPKEQSTPPSEQQTTSMQKEDAQSKLPKASMRKALFESNFKHLLNDIHSFHQFDTKLSLKLGSV
ncbi:nucleic acid-binding, OB-fold protein [Tanacetum coccineum]